MSPSDCSDAVSLGFAPILVISAATFAGSTGTAVGPPDAAVVADDVGVPVMPGTEERLPMKKTPAMTATTATGIAAHISLDRSDIPDAGAGCEAGARRPEDAVGTGGAAGGGSFGLSCAIATTWPAVKSDSGPDNKANASSTSAV